MVPRPAAGHGARRRRGRRPPHALRHLPAPHVARRAAAAAQRAQGRHEPDRPAPRAARLRRACSSSNVYRYGDRHRVKSGITGWAQVHGLRGKTSLTDRVEWDNFYIENWSLWLDVKILLMTVWAVLTLLRAGRIAPDIPRSWWLGGGIPRKRRRGAPMQARAGVRLPPDRRRKKRPTSRSRAHLSAGSTVERRQRMKRFLLLLAAATAALAVVLPATAGAATFRGVVIAKDAARKALVTASSDGTVRTVRLHASFKRFRVGSTRRRPRREAAGRHLLRGGGQSASARPRHARARRRSSSQLGARLVISAGGSVFALRLARQAGRRRGLGLSRATRSTATSDFKGGRLEARNRRRRQGRPRRPARARGHLPRHRRRRARSSSRSSTAAACS